MEFEVKEQMLTDRSIVFSVVGKEAAFPAHVKFGAATKEDAEKLAEILNGPLVSFCEIYAA
ncbi:hypothetical protein WJ85_07905 [Burkholderia ubonensis]|uniref:hypothetical protein n=1 Tax=Burkholderia ubonensis TaxID=101571 RepID=UPI000759A5E0|nr:hypothetical protein [Burkholderia ubonensis]KVP19402.1 hypothetical protein WJ85_07905 [Burkholderia ubonensis]